MKWNPFRTLREWSDRIPTGGPLSRADARLWAQVESIEDIGELTAQWLEGDIETHPRYYGRPDEETEALIPTLAVLNRSGYVTAGSQPGEGPIRGGWDEPEMKWWWQRAAVDGFARPETADHIRETSTASGLTVVQHDRAGWRTSWTDVVDVTRSGPDELPAPPEDSWAHTSFGTHLSRHVLSSTVFNVAAAKCLYDMPQVTVVDPEWGRNDLLWPTLTRELTLERDVIELDKTAPTERERIEIDHREPELVPDVDLSAFEQVVYEPAGDKFALNERDVADERAVETPVKDVPTDEEFYEGLRFDAECIERWGSERGDEPELVAERANEPKQVTYQPKLPMGLVVKAALGLKLSDEQWQRLEVGCGSPESGMESHSDGGTRSWGEYKKVRDQLVLDRERDTAADSPMEHVDEPEMRDVIAHTEYDERGVRVLTFTDVEPAEQRAPSVAEAIDRFHDVAGSIDQPEPVVEVPDEPPPLSNHHYLGYADGDLVRDERTGHAGVVLVREDEETGRYAEVKWVDSFVSDQLEVAIDNGLTRDEPDGQQSLPDPTPTGPVLEAEVDGPESPAASPDDHREKLVAAAREWIADCTWRDLDPELLDELPADEILDGVERHYDGGLEAFKETVNYDYEEPASPPYPLDADGFAAVHATYQAHTLPDDTYSWGCGKQTCHPGLPEYATKEESLAAAVEHEWQHGYERELPREAPTSEALTSALIGVNDDLQLSEHDRAEATAGLQHQLLEAEWESIDGARHEPAPSAAVEPELVDMASHEPQEAEPDSEPTTPAVAEPADSATTIENVELSTGMVEPELGEPELATVAELEPSTSPELSDTPASTLEWCQEHDVRITDGQAVMYKAVNDFDESVHGTHYTPGTTASCDDFVADGQKGHGLHFSPTPGQARLFAPSATQIAEVLVPVGDIDIISDDKVKAPAAECVRRRALDSLPEPGTLDQGTEPATDTSPSGLGHELEAQGPEVDVESGEDGQEVTGVTALEVTEPELAVAEPVVRDIPPAVLPPPSNEKDALTEHIVTELRSGDHQQLHGGWEEKRVFSGHKECTWQVAMNTTGKTMPEFNHIYGPGVVGDVLHRNDGQRQPFDRIADHLEATQLSPERQREREEFGLER